MKMLTLCEIWSDVIEIKTMNLPVRRLLLNNDMSL